MNRKDLKQLLKQKAEKVEVKDFSSEIIQNVNHVPNEKKSPLLTFRERFPWLIPTATACACLVIILTAIFVPKMKDSDIEEPPQIDENLISEKRQEVFSKEMLALGNIVSDFQNTKNIAYFKNDGMQIVFLSDIIENNDEYREIAKEINGYIHTAETFIDSGIQTDFKENTDEKYSGYAYKMTVAFSNLNNEKENYQAYFNESEKDELEVHICGIIIIDGKEFELKGKRNTEEDEVEMELSVKTGENSYIKVKNETEVNENEFEYEFYEDGKLQKGVSMEVSFEDGVRECEIEIREGGNKSVYEFEYKDGYIECTYKKSLTDTEEELTVFEKDGKYKYVFENGVEIVL